MCIFFTIKQIQLLHGWGTWVQLFVTHTVELQGLIEWFANFLSRGAGLFWFIFINPLISYFDIIIVSLNLLAPDQTHRSVNFGYLHSRNDWQLSFRLWITFLWLTLLIPVEPGKQVLYFTHPGVRLALCDVNFAVASSVWGSTQKSAHRSVSCDHKDLFVEKLHYNAPTMHARESRLQANFKEV